MQYIKRIALVFFVTSLAFACQGVKGQDTTSGKKKGEVPAAVQASFEIKYPGENDPDWHTDDHGYWESHFKIDGIKYRADFESNGTWVETETSIDKDDLPKAVKKILKEQYGDEEITEVEKVSSAIQGEFYDVEFKRKGKNKDVMFRETGEIFN